MSKRRFDLPDVLVLAAGGVVGEAWMSGVLAGLEDAHGVDFRDVEAFVGTSAGSIVAASLAAGRAPRRPEAGVDEGARAFGEAAEGAEAGGADPSGDGPAGSLSAAARSAARLGAAAAVPFLPRALRVAEPAGALARAAVLGRAPTTGRSLGRLREEVDRWGVRFDGRLRVCTVDRASGRRVVFGAPGAPRATVAEAVEASCSVPWVFRTVTIGGRRYVDGGAWSLTNLDAAPAGRDTHVLCLTVAGGAGPVTSPAGLLRAAARPAAAVEAAILRNAGAEVRTIAPDADAAGALGANLLDPRGAAAALAAGYAQGRRIAAA